jgi:hypothetical protein
MVPIIKDYIAARISIRYWQGRTLLSDVDL